MENIYLAIVLAPLIAAIVAGLFGRQIGRAGAHTITILGVGVAFVLSVLVAIVAAITLTMRKRPGLKVQDIARQVAVRREDRVRIVKMDAEKD